MNFADALDAALERGTYESPRVPRSAATFTSRHANPFLYSALGVPFAERRVFSAQHPSAGESAPSRDCTARTTTAFAFTRSACEFDKTSRDDREHEPTCQGTAANDDTATRFRAGERNSSEQTDAAGASPDEERADGGNSSGAFARSPQCDSADDQPGERENAGHGSARPRSRMLTVTERHALDTLVRHGARLTAAFSLFELRREYRRLARQLHPDTHPESTADERAHLSARFAAVSSSYQVLASAQI